MVEPRQNFSKSDLDKYSRYWLTRSETPKCISCHEDMDKQEHVYIEGIDTEGNDFFSCRLCGFRFIRKILVPTPVEINSNGKGR